LCRSWFFFLFLHYHWFFGYGSLLFHHPTDLSAIEPSLQAIHQPMVTVEPENSWWHTHFLWEGIFCFLGQQSVAICRIRFWGCF
jgi:hypothetical protein